MTEETRLFQQVDDELSSLLATTSPAYRRRLTYRLAKVIRGDQQRRIRSQKNSDGTAYQPRKKRVLRSKKQIKFLYKNEVRQLKGWRSSKGKRGRMMTGFDVEKGAVRSFYRHDIARYLSIDLAETHRLSQRSEPMFRRLRTTRFLRIKGTTDSAIVGFQNRAAEIARQHQYGLVGSINELAKVQYPKRELLSLSEHERIGLVDMIYQDLVQAK